MCDSLAREHRHELPPDRTTTKDLTTIGDKVKGFLGVLSERLTLLLTCYVHTRVKSKPQDHSSERTDLVGVVLVVTFLTVSKYPKQTSASRASKLTEVEVVVLGVANYQQSYDGVDDGWMEDGQQT